MEKIFKILASRIKSSTPKLFVIIATYATVIAALASIILILPISLPAWLISVLGLLISACAGFTTTSILTTDNTNLINQTNKLFKNEKP
jgi:hypothetical protein